MADYTAGVAVRGQGRRGVSLRLIHVTLSSSRTTTLLSILRRVSVTYPPGLSTILTVCANIKAFGTTTWEAVVRFFSSPLFYIFLGCSFIYISFSLLGRLAPCSAVAPSANCLELTQVNLAFGLLSALLGIAFIIFGATLHAIHIGQVSSLKQVYDQVKLFFSSPVFFILLGCFFLYCGLMLLDVTHSAFIFILTILGISMIFFGTGSQAVASASVDNPVSGKFSAGIAGGAAALAAIFGFGTIALEDKIQNFFERTVTYGFLDLAPSKSFALTLDFDKHSIVAKLPDERPLPILKQSTVLRIVVPRYSTHDISNVSVTIDGPSVVLVPPSQKTRQYQIDWDKVPAETSYANEKLHISRQDFILPVPPPNNLDDANRPQQSKAGQPIEPYQYVPQ